GRLGRGGRAPGGAPPLAGPFPVEPLRLDRGVLDRRRLDHTLAHRSPPSRCRRQTDRGITTSGPSVVTTPSFPRRTISPRLTLPSRSAPLDTTISPHRCPSGKATG